MLLKWGKLSLQPFGKPLKILIQTSHYPPLSASGFDARCWQVAEELWERGHGLQILTSNFRVPPRGIRKDNGVFRDLVLYANLSKEELRDLSYRITLAIDRKNGELLEDRVARFEPDSVSVWSGDQLSKSILERLHDLGIAVAHDLHSSCLTQETFYKDLWQCW